MPKLNRRDKRRLKRLRKAERALHVAEHYYDHRIKPFTFTNSPWDMQEALDRIELLRDEVRKYGG